MERIKKYAYTLPFVHTCFVVGTLPSISLSPRAHGLFLRLRWRWPSSELQPYPLADAPAIVLDAIKLAAIRISEWMQSITGMQSS
jgi:hypothetical protein